MFFNTIGHISVSVWCRVGSGVFFSSSVYSPLKSTPLWISRNIFWNHKRAVPRCVLPPFVSDSHTYSQTEMSFTLVRWLLNVKWMSRDSPQRMSRSFRGRGVSQLAPWLSDMTRTCHAEALLSCFKALSTTCYTLSGCCDMLAELSVTVNSATLADLQYVYIQHYSLP